MICRSHGHLQPLLLCLMPRIDGCNTLEMPHAWITLAHTSSRCIIHVCLMNLDPDDVPRGALGLQHAVNWLGREELLQQLGYSSTFYTRNCKSPRHFAVKSHSKGVHLRPRARLLKVGLQRAPIPLSPPHQALDIPLHQQ